ncbi:hypothetical protein [Ferrimonas futtsuensis]|uniref:hypothetical protein n=1 Tax=Ferrimonas futtsuensis TaxID=364764 RepID=UPI00041458FF|nr:hypothetical protein [Ferrimonas futtsuensis]
MNTIRLLLTMLAVATLTGCVSPMSLEEQSPSPEYQSNNKVLIAVHDQRTRVSEGKPETFIGVAHGTFGIPFDWHVNPVLATEKGDSKRTLAQFLEHRLVNGLQQKGWDVEGLNLKQAFTGENAKTVLTEKQAGKLLVLNLNEWYFSVNLNWVSAFNFDTDTLVQVYELQQGKLLEKQIGGRDVVEEKSDESPQNNILRAYRDQLIEILTDPEVQQSLSNI